MERSLYAKDSTNLAVFKHNHLCIYKALLLPAHVPNHNNNKCTGCICAYKPS